MTVCRSGLCDDVRPRGAGTESLERCTSDRIDLHREDFAPVGRRRAQDVVVATIKPVDEPTARNDAALRVVLWRAPATLRRLHDGPASRFAPRLADHPAPGQRRWF